MTSSEFIIWLKGFTEACNDFTPTPKQWDRIKEVLNEVQDYNDNPGIDIEIDDWYNKPGTNLFTPNGTPPSWLISGSTGVLNTGISNSTVTNLPNNTNVTYTTKHQLND
jgi:hypothetical protein